MRSSRAYERYATCQNAFRRFVVLLAKQQPLERPEPIERGPSLRTSDVR
ncbi:hypothetical protein [Kitasatospora purpeofusca]|nr:hypothetical protein [Kitasatospora purpeofusca]MCX4686667.1 hypothetical protein [Kitasatospora purpeofusca]